MKMISILLICIPFSLTAGLSQPVEMVVEEILEGSQAQTRGIIPGDVIISMDGQDSPSYGDMEMYRINHEPVKPVNLKIRRDGLRLNMELVPPDWGFSWKPLWDEKTDATYAELLTCLDSVTPGECLDSHERLLEKLLKKNPELQPGYIEHWFRGWRRRIPIRI